MSSILVNQSRSKNLHLLPKLHGMIKICIYKYQYSECTFPQHNSLSFYFVCPYVQGINCIVRRRINKNDTYNYRIWQLSLGHTENLLSACHKQSRHLIQFQTSQHRSCNNYPIDINTDSRMINGQRETKRENTKTPITHKISLHPQTGYRG